MQNTIDVLTELREKGNSRRDRWHTADTEPWTGADWSNAMCGEAGEAANVVKKIRRLETGTGHHPPIEGIAQDVVDDLWKAELIQALGYELADTIAYADLLAQHYGIDLRQAVAEKFNIVSEREGFPERIDLADTTRSGRRHGGKLL
jgi:NTP pyrophosphatase (non-canonical NTP hydrolase)